MGFRVHGGCVTTEGPQERVALRAQEKRSPSTGASVRIHGSFHAKGGLGEITAVSFRVIERIDLYVLLDLPLATSEIPFVIGCAFLPKGVLVTIVCVLEGLPQIQQFLGTSCVSHNSTQF